ncbi:MAG: DUF721 domain-containing protein [Acidimicrobiales bacterium]
MTWHPLPEHRGEGPRRLTSGLAGVTRKMGGPSPAVLAVVFGRWPEVAGPDLAGRCQPLAVRRGALVVAVSDPTMASELRWAAPGLLRRAEELAGVAVAERVEIRVQPA